MHKKPRTWRKSEYRRFCEWFFEKVFERIEIERIEIETTNVVKDKTEKCKCGGLGAAEEGRSRGCGMGRGA